LRLFVLNVQEANLVADDPDQVDRLVVETIRKWMSMSNIYDINALKQFMQAQN